MLGFWRKNEAVRPPLRRSPPGDNWLPWLMPFQMANDSPYRHETVELWRDDESGTHIVNVQSLDPLFNVADLYWRPSS